LRILVTGARGFIGSHLVRHFAKNHEVYAMVRSSAPALDRLAGVDCKLIEHDIKDDFDTDVKFDLILHAAGNPSAASSLADPLSAVQDNVVGTCKILDYARKNDSHVVYYSSGEVFGPKPLGVESSPDDPYNSASPYAAAKAGGEELCVAYSNSYGIRVSIIHINNTFGQMIQRERYPAIVIRKLLADEPISITVGPKGEISGRRWFHADDVAQHTEHVIKVQTRQCEKWNSAGDRFIDNLEFAKMIAQAVGKQLNYELVPQDRPGHDVSYNVDPTKLYTTGFELPYTTEERIQQMVDWTLNNKEWL